MESVEQLQKIALDAEEKLYRIRSDQFKSKNSSKVGKTFRTRNNFSCPEKPSDYWWLYAKITRMDDAGMLYATTFQTDKYGAVSINFDQCVHHAQYYSSCPAADFKKAWKAMLKKLNSTFE
jgi:hypothetical protein